MISMLRKWASRTLALAVGLLACALLCAKGAAAMGTNTSTTISGGSTMTHTGTSPAMPAGSTGKQTSTASSAMPAASSSGSSMSSMSKASMSHMSGMHSMSMGGMSMTVANHSTNILPNWLAIIWMLAFIVIIAIHGRHVLESRGQRRYWHAGHVFMAVGMAVMYAPGSVDHFDIPTGFWSLAFADWALAIVLWIVVQVFAGRGTNVLWLMMAFDTAAMAYMWTPSGYVAPITWLLVAYFAWQAVLWGTNRMRRLDERTVLGGGISVSPDGTMAASVAEPLICYKDLRFSMAAMSLGMAYMFAAMQLLM